VGLGGYGHCYTKVKGPEKSGMGEADPHQEIDVEHPCKNSAQRRVKT
jgi:hypothetical protein